MNFHKKKIACILKKNEKISLLSVIDYKNSRSDDKCQTLENMECSNRNYLAEDGISTWLVNVSSLNDYEAFELRNSINISAASNYNNINPVIYVTKKVISQTGKGSKDNPYIVK